MTKNKSKKSFLKTYVPILLFVFFSAAAAGLWYFAPKAFAGTSTNNITVSASAIADCSISAATLAFGNYDPTTGLPLNGTATTTIVCTQGSTPSIIFGLGNNNANIPATTPVSNWAMNDAAVAYLGYNMYEDSAHTTLWPKTGGTPLNLSLCTGTNSPCYNEPGTSDTTTIYGQIPASQNVPVAAYGDSVVMTVSF